MHKIEYILNLNILSIFSMLKLISYSNIQNMCIRKKYLNYLDYFAEMFTNKATRIV